MVRICSRFLFCAFSLLVVGCERKPTAVVVHDSKLSASAPREMTSQDGLQQSPDFIKAVRMRDALDSGEIDSAKVLARELMDSKEAKVRLLVVDAMEWMGKPMASDLIELAQSDDEITAEAALQAWERIVDGVPSETQRIHMVFSAVTSLKNPTFIDAALLHLVACDRRFVLPDLAKLIERSRGTVVNVRAREAYAHIAREEWESVERTSQLLEDLKQNKGKL